MLLIGAFDNTNVLHAHSQYPVLLAWELADRVSGLAERYKHYVGIRSRRNNYIGNGKQR
jgi:hypothetical protein